MLDERSESRKVEEGSRFSGRSMLHRGTREKGMRYLGVLARIETGCHSVEVSFGRCDPYYMPDIEIDGGCSCDKIISPLSRDAVLQY